MKKRVALLVDKNHLKKWQLEALEEAKDIIDIRLILSCNNTKTNRKFLQNFFYYVLNFFTLKNQSTSKISIKNLSKNIFSFRSSYEGVWQLVPNEVTRILEEENIDLVIKFGMSLLKIDDNTKKFSIFSYHHGDPSKYRGRPAGFYELFNNENKVGVVVQELSNNLDAGKVYSFAESKVMHDSYKQTALNFYRVSRFLLRKAIINYEKNRTEDINPIGKNYSLPSNLKVFLFLTKILYRKTKKILYGIFFEKKWNVGTYPMPRDFQSNILLDPNKINIFNINGNYTFYADPFFSSNLDKVRVEALNKRNGIGDILEIDLINKDFSKVILSGNHYSYPHSFKHENKEYLLPEVASHSAQYCIPLDSQNSEKIYLEGLESKRIVDATLFKKDNIFFIFFCEKDDESNVLKLYFSNNLKGEYKKHPNSPICINPTRSRMGGDIFIHDENIFRFGQNNSRDYGSSNTIIRISKISDTDYEEEVCGSIKIKGIKGPHTVNFNSDSNIMLIDFYKNQFSFLAGYRRFLSKFYKQ